MKYIIEEALGRSEAERRIKPTSMIQSDEELVSVLEELTTVIRVIGCGGGGSNTIDRLGRMRHPGCRALCHQYRMPSIFCISMPTAFPHRQTNHARPGSRKLPAIGKRPLRRISTRSGLLWMGRTWSLSPAAWGGGTGTGASPVVAEAAREAGSPHHLHSHHSLQRRGLHQDAECGSWPGPTERGIGYCHCGCPTTDCWMWSPTCPFRQPSRWRTRRAHAFGQGNN